MYLMEVIIMKNLIEKTLDFQKSCYFNNNSNETDLLSDNLVALLNLFIYEDIDLNRYIRFYRNGDIDSIDSFKTILKKSKFNNISDLERVFNPDGRTIFSIIINKAEELSKELNIYITEKFIDNAEEFSKRNILLESTYFISNYKYTPFGIHKDDISNALHFNLTNQKRRMILWDDKYIEKKNLETIPKIDDVEKFGHTYCIDNKQSYFLPAQTFYHIGKNSGFNVSYAVAFINYGSENLVNKVLEENSTYIRENYSIDKNKNIDLQFLYEKYSKKYKSNNNIRGKLPKNKRKIILDLDTIFENNLNFKIEYTVDQNNNFLFFIRGHELTVEYHFIYEEFFKYINSNKRFTLGDLQKSISEDLDLEFYSSLLNILYQYNLLEVNNV